MKDEYDLSDGERGKFYRKSVDWLKADWLKTATIGRRPKEDTEYSDACNTPQWFCDLLPEVDIDPCSNDRSHVRSRWSYSLEKCLDGLKLPWRGSVFENFPYSAPMPWCEKTIYELSIGRCTEAIILCKLDSSTKWWDVLTSWDPTAMTTEPLCQPPDLWLLKDRVQYDEHPELIQRRIDAYNADKAAGRKSKYRKDGKSSNNFCSAVIHHRPLNGLPLNLSSVATLWWQGL